MEHPFIMQPNFTGLGEVFFDEECFDDSGSIGNFYPFDSKEAVLLYILINNPLPVVSG